MKDVNRWTSPDWEPLSDDEPARLQEVVDLGLAREQPDPFLEEITRQAAARFGVPISLVSIVLDGSQCFAAAHGLRGWAADAQGTPVEYSFCAFAVRSRDVFVVEDAMANPLVQNNPLVAFGEIGSYAGVPLTTSRGQVVGTLCVIGIRPRRFSPEDLEDLRRLGRRVEDHLETRRAEAGGDN